MTDIEDIKITVTVHFSNGITLEKDVPLKKAVSYINKEHVIVPTDTDYIEIHGQNESIIVPIHMTFVIPKSPPFPKLNSLTRYNLYKRDKGKCSYCGKLLKMSEMTVDHVIPKSQKGKDSWENLVTACQPCNSKKDNMFLEEVGMKLLITPHNPNKHF